MTSRNYRNSSSELYWVKENMLAPGFPDVSQALRDPNGLLAIGGDLTEQRLLEAYEKGIFPWYNEGQPILWWSPNPRCILEPAEIKISRSLAKRLRKNEYHVTINTAFNDVIENCAGKRKGIDDTWITNNIKKAFINLFNRGYAHSVECWHNNKLIGGLYGLAIGKIFFGESMFSHRADASKIALIHLANELESRKFRLIDCQVHSAHLQSLGAKPMHREMFIRLLESYCTRLELLVWD